MTKDIWKKSIYWLCEKYSYMKTFFIFLIILFPLTFKSIRIFFSKRHVEKKRYKYITVGFFHPNCIAGTPQENLLWTAVKAIESHYNGVQIVIYNGNKDVKSEAILEKVESQFRIKFKQYIRFVNLRQSKWLRKFAYMGSIWVAYEALAFVKPHIMIDTVGYGFVNLIFKYIGGCKVVSYIHNPLVTIDELHTRHVRLENNHFVISRRSPSALGISKAISILYGWAGRSADIVMVNSMWTKENINSSWKCPKRTYLVYPPIGLDKLMKKAECYWDKKDDFQIINATEFKSQNNHELILQTLDKIRDKINHNIMNELRLVLINLSAEEDKAYTEKLEDLVKELNLEKHVRIIPESPNANRLEEELVKSTYGIYAKADDPFGSDLIAGLTAGQIMIVHNSGAAKNELIDNGDESRNGYLATTLKDYSEALIEALQLSPSDKRLIQKNARRTAEKFTRHQFQKDFLKVMESFTQLKPTTNKKKL